MSTKFHQDVDKLLECPVCLEQIKRPKMLPCQHTFCRDPCLFQMIEKKTTRAKKLTIECPICRENCLLGRKIDGRDMITDLNVWKSRALDELPDNLNLKNLLEIRKSQPKLDEATGVFGMYDLKKISDSIRTSHQGPNNSLIFVNMKWYFMQISDTTFCKVL